MAIRKSLSALFILALCLAACGQASAPAFPTPDQDYTHLGLSDAEAATLLSLELVDEYPLYTMHQYAEYDYEEFKGARTEARRFVDLSSEDQPWACTLFVALADPQASLFGRNFDWSFSPTVLLFSDPPDGYASAAMVNISYLGFAGALSENLTAKPIDELVRLLDAHHIPFDGLNEAGLTIGMAAVSPGNMDVDPSKESVGSLGIIRVVLDKAATVDEAIGLLGSYNIDFEGGPPLHYLVADAGGDSVLVEFYNGEMQVIRSETPWYQASNFLSSAVESPDGQCWRHDAVSEELAAQHGVLEIDAALNLLSRVAQIDTQWSVVYGASSGEIRVVMGKAYDQVHVFQLEPLSP
jgi:hypothetical protein